jgi:protein O-GlcNAc transferase
MAEMPDLKAVCEAIADGRDADRTLYNSPAGPIAALDILYGHRAALMEGRESMAHKTGFTAETLIKALNEAGFVEVKVIRDGWNLKANCQK